MLTGPQQSGHAQREGAVPPCTALPQLWVKAVPSGAWSRSEPSGEKAGCSHPELRPLSQRDTAGRPPPTWGEQDQQ